MILRPGTVRVALLLLAALLVVAPACTTVGGAPSRGGVYGARGDVVGEVRAVDARRGRIHVREAYGRARTVRYDRGTRVFDGRREYPVSWLRRGDGVRIRVVYDRRGAPWADRVYVRPGGWERWGDHGRGGDDGRWEDGRWGDRGGEDGRWDDRWRDGMRVERLAGTVRSVELRRGYFTLEQGRSRLVVVRIPGRLDRDDARRVGRLRRGDYVHVEVRFGDRGAAELIRFR